MKFARSIVYLNTKTKMLLIRIICCLQKLFVKIKSIFDTYDFNLTLCHSRQERSKVQTVKLKLGNTFVLRLPIICLNYRISKRLLNKKSNLSSKNNNSFCTQKKQTKTHVKKRTYTKASVSLDLIQP